MRPSHLLLVLILSLKTVSVAFAQNGDGSKASTRPLAGQKNALALVIGNGDYANAGPLVKTLADADSMAAVLGGLGFEVIKRKNADLRTMNNLLSEFAARLQSGNISIALVYFSGHGIQANGENYLVPTDASPIDEADIRYTCLPAQRVLDQMAKPGVQTKIVLLDACRTNPFAKTWGRSADEHRGLATMTSPKGTFIAYAAAPGEKSYESSQKANGIFTHALLSHIRTPGLTIDQLFTRVIAATEDQAVRESREQSPWKSSNLRSDFYFRPAARPQPNPGPTDPVQPPQPSDYDGDGVADANDDCPTEPGKAAYRGCPLPPDSDGDGVADPDDLCPQQPGASSTKGCPDSDGDGLPDHLDKCPNEAGAAADKGCPKPKPTEQPTDPMGCIFIRGGTFQMGSTDGESDEKPVHTVTLTDFWLGKYEVTQAQWRDIMGSNPNLGFPGCDQCPVEHVSWNDIQDFLQRLNAKYPGKNYGLPTEAEWEYAARGGHQSKGYTYAGSNSLDEVAWYSSNSGLKTDPVGGKKANELGLYDMSGNVWEWCSDWYGEKYYDTFRSSSAQNPQGPSTGEYRVLRGGSWSDLETGCRAAGRAWGNPAHRSDGGGFRLARH